MNGYRTIRIRATGQVTEMVPDVARALLNSGMAEEVTAPQQRSPETMRVAAAEQAVAPAQHSSPPRKRAHH